MKIKSYMNMINIDINIVISTTINVKIDIIIIGKYYKDLNLIIIYYKKSIKRIYIFKILEKCKIFNSFLDKKI